MADKRDLLNALYQNAQGLGMLEMRALGGQGRPWVEFCSPGEFTRIHSFEVTATLQKHDVYFGVNLRDGHGGKKGNLTALVAVWCDLDFKTTPKEAALKALREFPFKATIIVSSGGGVHYYWCLKEPLAPAEDPTAIQRVENVNRRVAACLGGDPASVDATRILRMPDSENFKYHPPRLVKITYLSDFRYDLEAFEDALPEAPAAVATVTGTNGNKTEYTNENMAALLRCDFIKWCADNPAAVAEPLWYCLISNLASVRPGGVSLCHQLSKGHPGYSQKECDAKILHALEESRPISCAKIRERGFKCNRKCSVTSPAGLVFIFDDGVQGNATFAQIEFISSERSDAEVA